MQINGGTTVTGIFGDPVEHSLSPKMQNAAIQASGLNAVYVPFHVTSAQLCDAVDGLRALGLRGVNLTIPHKEEASRLVDELDEQARLIGAINTIVNTNGSLKGYNTDGQGLFKALKQGLGVDPAGSRILLVGAGGACRAALVSLCQAGAAWLGLANRTPERSRKLIEEFKPVFAGTAFAEYELSPSLLNDCEGAVDILINTTAVGLKGDAFEFDLTVCVKQGGAVYDMVYSSEPTPLVRDALAAGIASADGLVCGKNRPAAAPEPHIKFSCSRPVPGAPVPAVGRLCFLIEIITVPLQALHYFSARGTNSLNNPFNV